MLSDARTTQADITIISTQQEEGGSIQGEPDSPGVVTSKGDGDAALPTDPELPDGDVKTEIVTEGETTGQDQDKAEDCDQAAVDEEIPGLCEN